MSTGVTYGAYTDRRRSVAQVLSGSARALLQVQHAGTSSMGVQLESWAGSDTEVFAADWQQSVPVLAAAAERLSTLAKLLVEQAEQQDEGSRGSVHAGGIRGSGSRSDGRDPLEDLAEVVPALLSVTDGDGGYWPDPTAATGPTFGPQDPAFPRLVDMGTDWANDVYVDHIRDNPFSAAPLIERGLRESSDWIGDVKDQYEKKKTNRWPIDGPSILLDVVADELDTYADILHDPKGWWDNDASTWDKVRAAGRWPDDRCRASCAVVSRPWSFGRAHRFCPGVRRRVSRTATPKQERSWAVTSKCIVDGCTRGVASSRPSAFQPSPVLQSDRFVVARSRKRLDLSPLTGSPKALPLRVDVGTSLRRESGGVNLPLASRRT